MIGKNVWILSASVLMLQVGCESRNAYVPPPPPKVTIAQPVQRDVQEYFETTGQTRAVASVELRARVGGYLKEIKFKDGQMVNTGDLLFKIDEATYAATVESAEASVARAEAQLHLAEQQLLRTKHLAEKDAATQSSLDIQEAEKAATAADVMGAEASLREARLNLDYTEIRAPFSGRMGRHMVDVGNLIMAGNTLLASIETVDPIYTYFTLSESDLLRFTEMQKEGKLKRISDSDPIRLDLALGETGKFIFHGHLDFREFGIDPGTGTTERRAVFPNKDTELVPGLFVRIRAAIGDPQPHLLVDERAVGSDQRGDYLLIVNSENIVETRLVKLGIIDAGMRVIENGIAADDWVITNGLQRARPGSPVTPEKAPMEPAWLKAEEKAQGSEESGPPAKPMSPESKHQ